MPVLTLMKSVFSWYGRFSFSHWGLASVALCTTLLSSRTTFIGTFVFVLRTARFRSLRSYGWSALEYRLSTKNERFSLGAHCMERIPDFVSRSPTSVSGRARRGQIAKLRSRHDRPEVPPAWPLA